MSVIVHVCRTFQRCAGCCPPPVNRPTCCRALKASSAIHPSAPGLFHPTIHLLNVLLLSSLPTHTGSYCSLEVYLLSAFAEVWSRSGSTLNAGLFGCSDGSFAGRLFLRRKSDFQINPPVLSVNTEFSISFIILEASVKSNLDVKRMSETRLRFKLNSIYCFFVTVGFWSLSNGFVFCDESQLALVQLLGTCPLRSKCTDLVIQNFQCLCLHVPWIIWVVQLNLTFLD